MEVKMARRTGWWKHDKPNSLEGDDNLRLVGGVSINITEIWSSVKHEQRSVQSAKKGSLHRT